MTADPTVASAVAGRACAGALLGFLLLGSGTTEAGHELSFYPSFYPQEIRLEVVDPAAARGLLERNALHAYVGGDPFGGGSLPGHIQHVESLGSLLVLTFNPASDSLRAPEARCAAARA